MELKNRTLSNFAELVETGECKKFRGRLKTGIDLGTANTVLAVVDRNNRPIAGISAPSHAIQDGVIVNYYESVQLVTRLKNELEERLGTELTYGAAAIPPGVSEGSVKSIGYVLEGAGFEVMNIVDEPTMHQVIDWSRVDKSDYLLAMERSPVKDVEIKALLRAALTDRITDRLVYMKGIDASYHYEGYHVFRTEDL